MPKSNPSKQSQKTKQKNSSAHIPNNTASSQTQPVSATSQSDSLDNSDQNEPITKSQAHNNTEKTNQQPEQESNEIFVETVDPSILQKNDLILDIRSNIQHGLIYLKQPHWHIEGKDVHPAEFIQDYALDGKKKLYIICTTGMKSTEKAREFIQEGFQNVASVKGGIMGAKQAGLPVFEAPVDDVQQQIPLTAGICILIGLVGGFMISNWFYLLPLFVGIGFVTWGLTGNSTLAKVLTHMPWNKDKKNKTENTDSPRGKETTSPHTTELSEQQTENNRHQVDTSQADTSEKK